MPHFGVSHPDGDMDCLSIRVSFKDFKALQVSIASWFYCTGQGEGALKLIDFGFSKLFVEGKMMKSHKGLAAKPFAEP